jgi:hypothetical protein
VTDFQAITYEEYAKLERETVRETKQKLCNSMAVKLELGMIEALVSFQGWKVNILRSVKECTE